MTPERNQVLRDLATHMADATRGAMTFCLNTEFIHPIHLSSYLQLKQLSPGMILESSEGEFIMIGSCTPFMQVSESDGEIGWDWDMWDWFKIKRIWQIEFHNTLVNTNLLRRANEYKGL